MKKIILFSLSMIFLGSITFAADLNLKALWTANTDNPSVYKLYRTDGTRLLIGSVNHPTTTLPFIITVANGTEGTLTFVLTAVDASGNESADSVVASYPFDLKPPAVPTGFGVTKQ